MAAAKNIFIVFEGIDGAGCETQARLLSNYLQNKGKKVLRLKYPDYSDQYGKLIKLHLAGRLRLPNERLFLTHLINQLKDREKIKGSLKEGRFVVSDRYFPSNLAYNCDERVPVDKAVKVASVFGLPVPDLIFYLDTAPETAVKRKLKEKHALDVNER
ncbi:MAG: dTMP kinase, partial [archaeon]